MAEYRGFDNYFQLKTSNPRVVGYGYKATNDTQFHWFVDVEGSISIWGFTNSQGEAVERCEKYVKQQLKIVALQDKARNK